MGSWRVPIGVCVLAGGLLWPPQGEACDLAAGETAAVVSAVDGETLELADGRTVRLLGIKAPAPPPDWTGPEPWPFATQAKDALARLVAGSGPDGARLELRFDARREDRHGHLLAHAYVVRAGRRLWVQEELIEGGFARVYVLPDLTACIAPLLAAERQARTARRGLWRSLTYRVHDAHQPRRLGVLRHTYQLVEGTVHGIGQGRKLLYINFAEDWHSDFTIAIERKRAPFLEAAGLDFQALPGKRVRVRGWVEWWNGPMIAVTNPEEIEIVPPPFSGG